MRGDRLTVRVIVAFNVRSWRPSVAQRRCYNYGFRAGNGLELLRISDSGVSVAGLPLKMTAVWFLGERFDELLSVGGDHFQVQKRDVELFQLFLKPLCQSC